MDPVDLWRRWIIDIAADPEMDIDRTMRHLQLHVSSHMPNADAPRERWERWLAGTYNLLAILVATLKCDPPHEVAIARLMRHWQTAPTDHTPPPEGTVSTVRAIASLHK